MQVFLQICTNDGKLTYRGYDKYELWTFRSQDHSLPGAKVPGVELSLPGTFAPWTFRTLELSLPGTFAPTKQM